MNERSKQISRLLNDKKARLSYIKAKLSILVPSQIRALRLRSDLPTQSDAAKEAKPLGLHQSRISMLETPGESNMTLETLAKVAALFNVGLLVKFVPFSEMLHWENTFSQDRFDVTRLKDDRAFLNPQAFGKDVPIVRGQYINQEVPSVLGGRQLQGGLEAIDPYSHQGRVSTDYYESALRGRPSQERMRREAAASSL